MDEVYCHAAAKPSVLNTLLMLGNCLSERGVMTVPSSFLEKSYFDGIEL